MRPQLPMQDSLRLLLLRRRLSLRLRLSLLCLSLRLSLSLSGLRRLRLARVPLHLPHLHLPHLVLRRVLLRRRLLLLLLGWRLLPGVSVTARRVAPPFPRLLLLSRPRRARRVSRVATAAAGLSSRGRAGVGPAGFRLEGEAAAHGLVVLMLLLVLLLLLVHRSTLAPWVMDWVARLAAVVSHAHVMLLLLLLLLLGWRARRPRGLGRHGCVALLGLCRHAMLGAPGRRPTHWLACLGRSLLVGRRVRRPGGLLLVLERGRRGLLALLRGALLRPGRFATRHGSLAPAWRQLVRGEWRRRGSGMRLRGRNAILGIRRLRGIRHLRLLCMLWRARVVVGLRRV